MASHRFLLLRPHRIWLPTLWGWLLLLSLAVGLATLAGRHASDYLAPTEPARGPDGHGATTLIIEGWLDGAELDQAIAVLRRGHYERVLTTGGPIESWNDAPQWKTYAERAAAYLLTRGVNDLPVVAVPAPASAQDRSFLSAVVARDWLKSAGLHVDAVDLFSSGVHTRRSWLVYRMAFGKDVDVGVMAARPTLTDVVHWWTSSNGVKSVIGEVLSLAWTKCCFWPGARGSHDERWAVPASASQPAAASAPTSR